MITRTPEPGYEALRTAHVWVREARADWALALLRISEVVDHLPTAVRAELSDVTEALDAVARTVAGRLGREVI